MWGKAHLSRAATAVPDFTQLIPVEPGRRVSSDTASSPGASLLAPATRALSPVQPAQPQTIVDYQQEPASFSLLPPELALHILAFLLDTPGSSPQTALARFVRINRACHALGTPLLYASPCATSLAGLDALLAALAAGQHDAHVRALCVAGRVFASKGWGIRVNRALKACRGIERLELVGIDDLRAKHLVGNGGASSSSFDRQPLGSLTLLLRLQPSHT